jgi:hypothetical protein
MAAAAREARPIDPAAERASVEDTSSHKGPPDPASRAEATAAGPRWDSFAGAAC